jgi:hypothetical protein
MRTPVVAAAPPDLLPDGELQPSPRPPLGHRCRETIQKTVIGLQIETGIPKMHRVGNNN